MTSFLTIHAYVYIFFNAFNIAGMIRLPYKDSEKTPIEHFEKSINKIYYNLLVVINQKKNRLCDLKYMLLYVSNTK